MKDIVKDTDEQPDEKVERERSRSSRAGFGSRGPGACSPAGMWVCSSCREQRKSVL